MVSRFVTFGGVGVRASVLRPCHALFEPLPNRVYYAARPCTVSSSSRRVLRLALRWRPDTLRSWMTMS